MIGARLPCVLLATLLAACGAYRVSPDSQGVNVEPGPCGRGLVVVESDYQSSNVSLLDFDGEVLSPSLISSSTGSSGFSVALGRDVVPPSSPQTGARVVLIDRDPVGVLRFVELATAQITAELSVGTGFRANPQDYLALTAERAYVARYELNSEPGRQAWDGGGDLLIVDPSVPAITGRIDLSAALAGEPSKFTPHPARLLNVAGRVFALLAAYSADYASATSSRLVEIDPKTDSLSAILVLDGLRGCDALAVSPDQRELAVSCTGIDLKNGNVDGSGLALFDISGAPRLSKRIEASALGADPLGFALDYAAQGVLLFNTFGHFDLQSGELRALDSLLRLDTASGTTARLLQSIDEPFTLGGVQCALSCGVCFAADAKRAGGSVLRLAVDSTGNFSEPSTIRVETRIGLPPRYLGVF